MKKFTVHSSRFSANPIELALSISLVIVLAIAVLSMSGCVHNQQPKHIAAVGASGLAASLDAAEQVFEGLYDSGLITKDEVVPMMKELDNVNGLNQAFIANVRPLPSGTQTKAQVIGFWSGVAGELTNFTGPVFHVKNPQAQARVNEALSAIAIAANAVNEFLAAVSPQQNGQQIVEGVQAVPVPP